MAAAVHCLIVYINTHIITYRKQQTTTFNTMFIQRFIFILAISTFCFSYSYAGFIVGGWQESFNSEDQSEILDLAKAQASLRANLDAEPIQVLHFYEQVVAGTNMKLLFLIGKHYNCTIQAFKALPMLGKPTEVTSFSCYDLTC